MRKLILWGKMDPVSATLVPGQDLEILDDKLALACGVNGLQIFDNLLDAPLSVPTQTLNLEPVVRGSHIVDDMLIVMGTYGIECYNLASDPIELLWEFENESNWYSTTGCLLNGLLFVGDNQGQIQIISFDHIGAPKWEVSLPLDHRFET